MPNRRKPLLWGGEGPLDLDGAADLVTRMRRHLDSVGGDDLLGPVVCMLAVAANEVERLRNLVENEPCEVMLEAADEAAHEWLRSVGRGHATPQECDYSDGPGMVLEEAKRLHAALARAEGERDALINAYVIPSMRPDVHEDFAFRAVLRGGIDKWCASRAAAVAAVRKAAGLDAGKAGEVTDG